MKLHLPCGLLAAVLACFSAVMSYTLGADVISVNLSNNNNYVIPDTEELLLGVEAKTWNDIVNPATAMTPHTVTSKDGNTYTLNLAGGNGTWGASPGGTKTLESTLLTGYVDLSNATGIQTWTIDLTTDFLVSEVSFYMAGDSSPAVQYAPVTVNGTHYIGGAEANNNVAETSTLWGSRDNTKATVDETNTLKVHVVGGSIHAQNVANSTNRTSLAGFQVKDSTAEKLWVAGSGDLDSSTATFTLGENSSVIADITESDRILGFSSQSIAFNGETVAAIQATEGTVTLTGSVTTPILFVKEGATLDVQGTVTQDGGDLSIGGTGTAKLANGGTLGTLTNKASTTIGGETSVTTLNNAGSVNFSAAATVGTINSTGTVSFGENSTLTNYSDNLGTLQVATGKELTITNGPASSNDDKLLRMLAAADATQPGYDGTVKLTGELWCGGNIDNNGTRTLDVKGNYVIDGSLSINSRNGITTTVTEAGSLKTTGHMEFLSKQTFVVAGGEVEASAIRIGHTQSNADYHGTMRIESGSVKTGSIALQHGSSNASLLEMTGGTLEFTQAGTSAITKASEASEVKLLGGTLKSGDNGWFVENLGDKLTLGSVTLEGSKDITVMGGATLAGTIQNNINGGKFQLKGTLNVADITAFDALGDVSYSDNGNGYVNADYVLVQAGTGSNLVISEKVWVNGAETTVLTTDASATTAEGLLTTTGTAYVSVAGTGGHYYVNNGAVDYAENSQIASGATTGVILNGGSLNMSTGLNEAATDGIILQKDGSISLGQNVSLAGASITSNGHALRLEGSGTYVATADNHLNVTGLTDSTTWTGTVTLRGVVTPGHTSLREFSIDNYGHAGSTVELNGITGFMSRADDTDGTTYAANLKLTNNGENAAFKVNNGWGGDHRIFTGKVSGTGDIVRTEIGSGQSYTFSGDVSEWKGHFKHDAGGTSHVTTLTFNGDATDINVGFQTTKDNSVLNVIVDNDNAVTVGSKIEGTTKVTYKGTGVKTVTNGESNYNGGTIIEAGEVKVTAASALDTGALDTGALGTGDITIGSGATLTYTGGDHTQNTTYNLNGGTIKLSGGIGTKDVAKRSLVLGGNSIVEGNNAALYATVTGSGDLTLKGDSKNALTVYSDVQHTGKVALADGKINLGNWWGGSTSLTNTGDVEVTGATVLLDQSSSIANTGNVNISAGSLTMNNGTSIANGGSTNVTGTGKLVINSGATVSSTIKAGEVATIGARPTVARNATTPTYSDVEVTASGVSSILDKSGSVSNAAIDVTGAYDMSGVELSNTTVSVTETGALTLNNVTFGEGNTLELANAITLGSGSLDLSGVTVDVSSMKGETITLVNVAAGATVSYEGIDLQGASTSATVGYDANGNLVVTGNNASYTNNALITSVVGYDPSTFTLTFQTDVDGELLEPAVAINYSDDIWNSGTNPVKDLIQEITGDTADFYREQGLYVKLTDANGDELDLSAVTSLTINGYVGMNGGATYNVDADAFGTYYGPNIPEPTTTTLSLLALAALAARRRRQG